MTIVQKVYDEVEKLNKLQALKAIELIWNEKGVKDILSYYTAGSLELDDNSPDTKTECAGYLKIFKEAKKLVK